MMRNIHAGMVFDPSDGEIVSHYLPKLIANGGDVVKVLGDLSYVFKVSNVYSCKPWLLFANDKRLPFMKGNQRFVFSPRKKIAQKNCNGKRPRRSLQGSSVSEGEGGFWKSSTGDKPILDDDDGQVIGYSNMLNFYEYNNNTEKNNGKDGMKKKSSWLMYEYRLGGDMFQEWVICKIKNTLLPEADEYEAVWLKHLFMKDDQTGKIMEEGCESTKPVRNNNENGELMQFQGCSCSEISTSQMSLKEGSYSDNKADRGSKEADTYKPLMLEVDQKEFSEVEMEDWKWILREISFSLEEDPFSKVDKMLAKLP